MDTATLKIGTYYLVYVGFAILEMQMGLDTLDQPAEPDSAQVKHRHDLGASMDSSEYTRGPVADSSLSALSVLRREGVSR